MKRLFAGAAFVAVSLYVFFAGFLMVYPDSKEYRALSRLPIASDDFWHGIRPPVVPLFLKLSADNRTIASLQLIVYLASSLALAAAVSRWMARARLPAFAAILVFALAPQHLLWSQSISSESLTFSLLFCLLALSAVLCRPPRDKVWQIVAATAWLVTAALFVFARDANGYLLICLCVAALLAFAFQRNRTGLLLTTALLAFTVLMTSVCAHQATLGGRWKWPFVNILGQRVLWQPERVPYFVERGMPLNDQVMCLANRWGSDCHDDLSGFGRWLDRDIKGIYSGYLLRHPLESLVLPFLHLDKTLMAHDGPKGMFYYFAQPDAWYLWFGRAIFEWPVVLMLLVIAFVAGAWRLPDRRALLPALTLLASLPPMLFFIYHADAAEPMRHAVVPASLLRLGLVFGILIVYDWMSLAWRANAQAGNTSL